ncbi:hypothetical protein MBLNU457_6121t1 [Dothideomycetes sp. NU457]
MAFTSSIKALIGLLGLASARLQFPDCQNGPSALTSNLVCNTAASPADRAAAIVAAMNITEKLGNLVDNSTGAPRIGLPPYEWWSEALHGVGGSPGVNYNRTGQFSYATSFAMPIVLSAAFDDQMIQDIATIISTEARAFSNAGRAGLDFFTPNINPYKDPRWGRGSETPGEDPTRIQNYVAKLLYGLEGGVDPPTRKVIATCKHFAAYDMEAWDGIVRYGFNAIVNSQDLAEYYLPPFQTCARDSKVGSFMCSYNAVNGVPSCANSYLLEDILRDHWNWTNDHQYVTSDCNAIQNIYANHNYTQTDAQAIGVAWAVGNDNSCEAGSKTNITGSYAEGLLTVDEIDTSLRRMYEGLIRAGYFNPNSSEYRNIGWDQVNTPQAQQLARSSASDGMVLLKNDGLFPLKSTANKVVAMIGFWANGTNTMQGGYSGPAPYVHSPLYAAQQLGIDYIYATGPLNQSETTGNWTEAAMDAANKADIILYFGGINGTVEAESLDRYQIAYPASQVALLEQISSLGKPTAILQMGDQLDSSAWLSSPNISAIIWAGYPGQDGGPALFDLITGVKSPAGRLPVTQYPADYVNEIALTDMALRPAGTTPGRTYKWYDNAVLPFGYGLSYTKFTASFQGGYRKRDHGGHGPGDHGPGDHGPGGPPKPVPCYDINTLTTCKAAHPDLCPFPSVSINIKNSGTVSSDFVALLFVNGTYGPAPYPLKTLVAYTRLRGVQAGASVSASLDFPIANLARRDAQGNMVLYPGVYNLLLDVPTQAVASFELTGQPKVLDQWPQPPVDQTA